MIFNLSKLQLKILNSYNTHSNQTTFNFNIFHRQVSCSDVNNIRMSRIARSTFICP